MSLTTNNKQSKILEGTHGIDCVSNGYRWPMRDCTIITIILNHTYIILYTPYKSWKAKLNCWIPLFKRLCFIVKLCKTSNWQTASYLLHICFISASYLLHICFISASLWSIVHNFGNSVLTVLGTLQASAASKPVPAPKSNLAERHNAPQCATWKTWKTAENCRQMQKAYHGIPWRRPCIYFCVQLASNLQDFACRGAKFNRCPTEMVFNGFSYFQMMFKIKVFCKSSPNVLDFWISFNVAWICMRYVC